MLPTTYERKHMFAQVFVFEIFIHSIIIIYKYGIQLYLSNTIKHYFLLLKINVNKKLDRLRLFKQSLLEYKEARWSTNQQSVLPKTYRSDLLSKERLFSNEIYRYNIYFYLFVFFTIFFI